MTQESSDKVVLSDSDFIGQGCHRACYRHPNDKSLCIKIPFEQESEIKPLRREFAYYKRLEKRNIDWRGLSRYLGDVETNKGHGAIYSLVTDDSGEVAKNLVHYLETDERITQHYDALCLAMCDLLNYLLEQKILPLTLYPRNLVMPLSTQIEQAAIIIVDDIGNNEFVRFSEWHSGLARKKITRKWQRFLKHLAKDCDNRPMLTKLLASVQQQTSSTNS